jgi:hypothetical protein
MINTFRLRQPISEESREGKNMMIGDMSWTKLVNIAGAREI